MHIMVLFHKNLSTSIAIIQPIMLTTQQVANQIGISHPKLLRLRREGKIPQGKQLHKYAGVEWSEEEVRKIREVVNG